MPTGTRSSINMNRTTKPTTAMASVLMCSLGFMFFRVLLSKRLRLEDQAPGADRDQHHGRNVAGPRDRVERPGRDVQVIREHVVDIGAAHLVEQHGGLH